MIKESYYYRVSVRPSVLCPSQADIVSKLLDESSWYLTRKLPSTYPTTCYKKIRVSPKIRVLPSGTLSQTSDLSSILHDNKKLHSSTDESTHYYCGDHCNTLIPGVTVQELQTIQVSLGQSETSPESAVQN